MDLREKEIYKVTLTGSAINAVLIVVKFIRSAFGDNSIINIHMEPARESANYTEHGNPEIQS